MPVISNKVCKFSICFVVIKNYHNHVSNLIFTPWYVYSKLIQISWNFINFRKIYLELIFRIFLFKTRTGFCNTSTFSWPSFAHKKILIFILRCFQSHLSPEDLENLIFKFLITYLFIYKIHNFNNRLKIWGCHQESRVTQLGC